VSVKGSPRFNGLAAGRIEIDFLRNPIHIEVTAAFIDTETGHTHGWTKGEGAVWSPETRQAIKKLRESMEADLARIHFTDHATAPPGLARQTGGEGGLGEHLGVTDAPSV